MALTKLIHNCETGITEEIELTADEIEQLELDRAQAMAEQEVRETEQARVEALKVSARSKLVEGTKLTAEEAALLVV